QGPASAEDDPACVLEDRRDVRAARRLAVHAQQRLGAASAEQQPGGDGAGATQVELEPVQVLRRGDAPARERALRSADALNDLLRRLVTRQVQVQTVVR